MRLLMKNAHIITPYDISYNFELAVRNNKINHIEPSYLDEKDFDEVIDVKKLSCAGFYRYSYSCQFRL